MCERDVRLERSQPEVRLIVQQYLLRLDDGFFLVKALEQALALRDRVPRRYRLAYRVLSLYA